MSLATKTQSPLDEIWVSLDLETTGLSAEDDDIIEIGAVKFQGNRELDTFQTFVNPHRELNDFVKDYTGITQADVDGAPSFSSVAGKLGAFVGMAPVVGHNISFDLGFLAQKGLILGNPRSDTWDLAVVLFPALPDYSLGKLARSLGIVHPRPHRAVEDALVTRDVFLDLVTRLSQLDVYSLAEIRRLAERSSWSLSYIVDRVEEASDGARPLAADSKVGVAGLDMEALAERLKRRKALRPNRQTEEVDVELVASLLRDGGPLTVAMPGFEERKEQVAMARAVGQAINGKARLIVEAGTGVGKSLAYLLPAAIYALTNNKRVVVSTNTINLQEQLLNKDIPILLRALADVPGVPAEDLKFTQLKGRANYLCLRRWSHLRSSESLSENEARLMAKTLIWLQTTVTGDRSELNLAHRGSSAAWDRLSARGALECLGAGGTCFLRAARERAAASHLVIVNHALLLSDVAAEGSLIPDYDVLIVDEAHHLEEEATRHLGFELGQGRFDEYFRSFTGDRGLLSEAITAFRGSSAADTRRRSVENTVAEAAGEIPRARDNLARMFATLESLLSDSADDGAATAQELRVTTSTRAQPAWSDLEIQWEAVDLVLADLNSSLWRLQLSLEGLEEAGLIGYQGLMMEMANAQQVSAELRQRLAEFVPNPRPDGIYWMSRNGRTVDLSLHGAPLQVGESLESLLYSRKECVVLTSATLSANGTFDHVRRRTGFEGADGLLLGSPFDYPDAALLCVPEDIPEPASSNYPLAATRAIADAAVVAGGRTLALFTSYAALQATAGPLRSEMEGQGISVLAQGSDGSPLQLMRRFVEDSRTVLLGTASFWEGVDFAGEALKVLLVMRLPFSVPSEPVFAARSELYEDPFNEYAVPNAILRLRQGFGRLIRTKTDRGVVVVMDRRLVSRKYGKAFLDSLPPVSLKTLELRRLGDEIRAWIDR